MSMWTLIAVGFTLLLVRRRDAIAAGEPLFPRSLNINNLVISPLERSAEVASIANPTDPSTLGSEGRGTVTPTTMTGFTEKFPGSPVPWLAPNAGVTQLVTLPGDPAGVAGFLQPVVPGQPTPQSAVSPDNPLLPDAELPAPLAANAWYGGLSLAFPYIGLSPGSGGIIDVRRVDMDKIFFPKDRH